MVSTASWLGHEFAALELTDLEVAPRISAYLGLGEQRSDGTLHYKYTTWRLDEGHRCARLFEPARWQLYCRKIPLGKGRVNFRPWEQMPTQSRTVEAFSALPIIEQREGWCVEILGGSDISQQRPMAQPQSR